MLQKVTCEEVIEEKATADHSETQLAKMTKKDREENGHFGQGDENKKKMDGRQARAMHRNSKIPKAGRVTKAHYSSKEGEGRETTTDYGDEEARTQKSQ
jgi:hypothetical protein